MAFAEGIAVYRLARFGREAEHTELIGNKALALAETIRKLILSEIETINKGFITFRLLKEIEILALEVLDDCHESRIGGRGVALDDAGNGLPAEHANRAQTAFACDKLIAAFRLSHDKGLNEADLLDGTGKLRYAFIIKALSRLVGIRKYFGNGQLRKLSPGRRLLVLTA